MHGRNKCVQQGTDDPAPYHSEGGDTIACRAEVPAARSDPPPLGLAMEDLGDPIRTGRSSFEGLHHVDPNVVVNIKHEDTSLEAQRGVSRSQPVTAVHRDPGSAAGTWERHREDSNGRAQHFKEGSQVALRQPVQGWLRRGSCGAHAGWLFERFRLRLGQFG